MYLRESRRLGFVLNTMFNAGRTVMTLCLCGVFVLAPATEPGKNGESPDTGLPWANGRFVYEFSPEVLKDTQKVAAFEEACSRLLEGTALSCVPRAQAASDRDYIFVTEGGCDCSFVGRQGGKQLLSIMIWDNPIIISHEIKHALGWGHEQQHPDRDRYVAVMMENIPPGNHPDFAVFDAGNEGPYDFDSMMHYQPGDFALPARKAMMARPEFQHLQRRMGQRDHLSATDLQEIQEFYGDASVQWCGISRKPEGDLLPGCTWVCRLETDPAVGAWLPNGDC